MLTVLLTEIALLGHYLFWNGYIIAWSSTETKHLALCTTKAVFIAFAEDLKNVIYLKNMNSKIVLYKFNPTLFEDNQGFINWPHNQTAYQAKTKHIDICYQFARELYRGKVKYVSYVSSCNQIADILTKPLSVTSNKRVMQLYSDFSVSRGVPDN